tara:strand:+ start:16079 stop:16255 length:177 start_codon:yes stop_codon:yes gene_type:complete
MKFKCNCKEFEVKETKIMIVNNKVVHSGAYCNDCKTYGKEIKTFDGWGTIVSKKGGKV